MMMNPSVIAIVDLSIPLVSGIIVLADFPPRKRFRKNAARYIKNRFGGIVLRVCILMGSPRLDGNTAELCKPFVAELLLHEAEIEYIELHGKDIAPCLGCYRCQDVADEYGCVRQDDMQTIVGSILKADVLVFATPIYTWQATPPVKAVMDRMYGLNKFYGSAPRSVLNDGQAYALIATCGCDLDYGAGLLDEALRRWCAHSGLPYIGMYAVRDEDNLASFQTVQAVAGARDFARKILEYKKES